MPNIELNAVESSGPGDCAPWTSVVRIQTTWYQRGKGKFVQAREMTLLRRKSGRDPFLAREVSEIGVQDVMDRITNLDDCADGLYLFKTCNEHRDWETGVVDDYDFQLIPYKEP